MTGSSARMSVSSDIPRRKASEPTSVERISSVFNAGRAERQPASETGEQMSSRHSSFANFVRGEIS